ncbi:hypothetical protein E4K72_08100 [Oxalobacteraceae bacterium OM1]|nr:hypothetical protein E4K72_08100 [Oxalobacteraceae bacterium OM1]
MRKAASVGFLIMVSVGGSVLLTYFARHSVGSGGLSVADAIALALLAMAFGWVVGVALGYGTLAAYPLVRLITRCLAPVLSRWEKFRIKRRHQKLAATWEVTAIGPPVQLEWDAGNELMLVIGSAALAFLGVIAYYAAWEGRLLILAMVVAGGWLSIFAFGTLRPVYCRWPRSQTHGWFDVWFEQLPRRLQIIIVNCVVVSGILLLVGGTLEDSAMVAAGFRKHDVSIYVGKDAFAKFNDTAQRLGLTVNACEPITSDTDIIHHVDILWHQIGTNGLLRYPSQPLLRAQDASLPRAQFRIEVRNDQLQVVDEQATPSRCSELSTLALFDGKFNIRPQSELVLMQELAWLAHIPANHYVEVVVHGAPATASPSEVSRKTILQAAALRTWLANRLQIDSKRIVGTGLGDQFPKQACTAVPPLVRQRCINSSRRVEIRVRPEAERPDQGASDMAPNDGVPTNPGALG